MSLAPPASRTLPRDMRRPRKTSYHHGNLHAALLEAALDSVRELGVGAISLREVARRAGDSHAAPAHHFGDKAGLLTSLAAQGFERFGASLNEGAARGGSDAKQRLAWVGWAYVMFAAEHRAYFEIMFRPELLHYSDPTLAQAASSAYQILLDAVRALRPDANEEEIDLLATRSWAEVHGLATLWLHGNLKQHASRADLDKLVRRLCGLP